MLCALLQINPKVGDIDGNAKLLLQQIEAAARCGVRLAISPEMALIGYPPRDLLLYPTLVERAEQATLELAQKIKPLNLSLILGSVGPNRSGQGKPLHNQALFIDNGQIVARYYKRLLPTYDVFDETRYFEPGDRPLVVNCAGYRLALTICEDIWNDGNFWPERIYQQDPLAGHPPFDVLINLSASPFAVGKQMLRQKMIQALARKYSVQALYVNQVGGNDELIFDGRSLHITATGQVNARATAFVADLKIINLADPTPDLAEDDFTPEAEIFNALVLGVRDYCWKTEHSSALLGLSGGIDSALVAIIACEALGPKRVHGLIMPSPYSSEHSVTDALALAANLKMGTSILAIEPAMLAMDSILAPAFAGRVADTTEENLQARLRGGLLMAFSNKFGPLLLSTGNKSELSIGYSTIYGDMCGGLTVIGDLYKTKVFKLCRWLNQTKGIIPKNIILKPPSAELRPDQTDQDSLPPYDELDAILHLIIEGRKNVDAIVATGHSPVITAKVASLVKAAEFKRHQAAPILKTSALAFGLGWRMPIAAQTAYI
ncbi:MAG: NAD synthetase [Candidatus Adiutrix intracellularis]|jgi:NAD+ synthase/NAD+ synthase (glutamine-hydrolysing)|nr:MAG: NAD synthetase [Candidatus Adiutrix intracellularis]MDR2827707.1 NAD+ synthase [Candidatus Adiutrix intracellularis]